MKLAIASLVSLLVSVFTPLDAQIRPVNLSVHLDHKNKGGLKKILKERYFRAITTRSSFDFYIYQGKSKGIQFEMVQRFADYLNRKYTKKGQLPIRFDVIPMDWDQMIPALLEGKADFIAASLTRTPERLEKVAFGIPYRRVNEVLLVKKSDLNRPLENFDITVRKESSYRETIEKINHSRIPPLKLKFTDSSFTTETLMELVSIGLLESTLVDSNLAELGMELYPDLGIHRDGVMAKKRDISWVTRKGNKELLGEINKVLKQFKKGRFWGNYYQLKYFSDVNKIRSESFNQDQSILSPYDKLIKKYSIQYGLDWRLMTALCYQESRFNPAIVNRWGAIGLFQIKQSTASDPYVGIHKIRGVKNLENNIHAGIKYFAWIKKTYFDKKKKMSERERLRFTMGSYNAGPGTILRAIRRAKRMGLNPYKWFRNVEIAVLSLRKVEPVTYVSEINKRLTSFKLLGIQ